MSRKTKAEQVKSHSGNPVSTSETHDTKFITPDFISPYADIIRLQRTIGNIKTVWWLKNRKIRAKSKRNGQRDFYELEADRLAEKVLQMPDTYMRYPKTANNERINPKLLPCTPSLFKNGRPLSRSIRNFFEPRFGYNFSGIRIHDNQAAARAADSMNAHAFTLGEDIIFGGQQYTPGSRGGKKLLAHELVHVIQQTGTHIQLNPAGSPESYDTGDNAAPRGDGAPGIPVAAQCSFHSPGVQCYCDPARQSCPEEFAEPAFDVCIDPQLSPRVNHSGSSGLPRDYQLNLMVAPPPALEGMSSEEWTELALSLPVMPLSEEHLDLYAVPVQYVFRTREEAENGQCRSGDDTFPDGPGESSGESTSPPAPDLFPLPSVEPDRTLASTTDFRLLAPGVTVYTLDGPIELISATTDYVVTRTYTKLAVGAGSTTLVLTPAGFILVDAGMHQRGGDINTALADAAIERIETIVGTQTIAEVIITHMHADHTALIPRIYARFEIGLLRVNALQAMLPYGAGGTRIDALARQMAEARITHVTAAVRQELETQGGPWDSAPTAAARQSQFDAAVSAEVSIRIAAMQPTRVMLNIPSGGRVHAADMPLGNIEIPENLDPDAMEITQSYSEPGMVTILDTMAGAETANLLATGDVTGGSPIIDAQSTTYVLDIPGGTRLFVISDQRTEEIPRLQNQLEAALDTLGRPSNLVLLDVTHHLQRGWISRTGLIRARQLARVTRMLSDLAARSGSEGALIVSVYGDPANSSAPNYVDPASRWIFEALGFHVITATGGGSTLTTAQDVAVLEVALGQDISISGIIGGGDMGLRPQNPLLLQAHATQRLMEEEVTTLRAELATDLTPAERTRIEGDISCLEDNVLQIQNAVQDYLTAVELAIGRGPTSSRPAVAPAAEGAEPAPVEATALRALLTGTAEPAVIDRRFTAAALVVIGQEQYASLDSWARELLAARYQVRAEAAALRALSSPGQPQQMMAALERYRVALEVAFADAPESSAQILLIELGRVDADISTVTGLSLPDIAGIRAAAALATQAEHNMASPLEVNTLNALNDPDTIRRAEAEHNGLLAVNGHLYEVSRSGETIQLAMVSLAPLRVLRNRTGTPSPGGPALPANHAITSARSPRGGESGPTVIPPIVVPGQVPAELAAHPNIINISGHPIILGAQTIAPTPWTPVSSLQPGELVIRGYSEAWIVAHPQTGEPIAGAAIGGEWWRVEANGTWTLLVDSTGAVRRSGSPAIVSSGGPSETYGRRHPGATEEAGGSRISGGMRVAAGALAILMIAQDILAPIGRGLNIQRYNIEMARGRYLFWVQAGAKPSHQMRTARSGTVLPWDTEASTSVFSEPVYDTVTRIDVAQLAGNLPRLIQTYRDLILWLDMGKQLNAIIVDPPMPNEPSAVDRAIPRRILAVVAGEAGTRQTRYQDITSIVEGIERNTLADTEAEMRQRVGGWTETQRSNIYRLRSGAQTPVYRMARNGLIRSSADLFGPQPWVRVIDRVEGSGISWFFGRRPYNDRVKVIPANADAERSALVSAYLILDDIEDVLEEVEEAGREIISRHPQTGRLESFIAGPMPSSDRFGETRYYRHGQNPHIWTVAIGQLNQFWVDADQLVPIMDEHIETYVREGNSAQ